MVNFGGVPVSPGCESSIARENKPMATTATRAVRKLSADVRRHNALGIISLTSQATTSTAEAVPEGAGAPEITEEMIAAGLRRYADLTEAGVTSRYLVAEVFAAMSAAREALPRPADHHARIEN